MSQLDYQFFYRRNLPHYQPPGAIMFVTFRLAGSIPKTVLDALEAEAQRVERAMAAIQDPEQRKERAYLEQRRLFGKWDNALDAPTSGPYWLSIPEVADLVCSSLHFLDGRDYKLDAFSIMSNHVHTVFTPLKQEDDSCFSLSRIMHSLKLYTARHANQLLGRTGQFWDHERYDHAVRDEAEWRRIVQYVLNNPVKAGLVDD